MPKEIWQRWLDKQWLLLVEARKQTRIFQLLVEVIKDGVVLKSCKIAICIENANSEKCIVVSFSGRTLISNTCLDSSLEDREKYTSSYSL